MSPAEWTAFGTVFAGVGAGVYRVLDRYMGRGVDRATAEKLQAEAKDTAQKTAAGEVSLLREIIAEVRIADREKAGRIDALEKRMALIEERERHALTRAATHEAWDRLAIQFILLHNEDFPAPPPLTDGGDHN